MGKNYRAGLVGVFGCPVDENPSVIMQEAAFKACGLNWRYLTVLVRPNSLPDAFKGMLAMNFAGVNLTIPHKVAGMALMDEVSDKAKLIGAVNTVIVKDGRLFGENTDGAGFVAGLQKQDVSIKGSAITVLGAGGASRAICVECALAGCARLTVINRDISKAKEICAAVEQNTACAATALQWRGTAPVPSCDILVNATSVGLFPDSGCPDIDYGGISSNIIVQDIIPNPPHTEFLRRAAGCRAQTFNGLSMLAEQGAIGFALWTKKSAPVQAMYQALADEYG